MSISDPRLRREISRLFDLARRNGVDPAKRHHIIPRSYLERWEHHRKILAVDVNNRTAFSNIARNVGFIDHFYNLESDDLDPYSVPPMLMETLLGQVEGWAVPIVDKLIDHGESSLTSKERLELAAYLSFQYTRGVRHRTFIEESAAFHARETLGAAGEPFVRETLGAAASDADITAATQALKDLRDGTITVAPQRARSAWLAAFGAEAVAPQLLARRWKIYQSDVPLITCDEPVLPICSPDLDARQTWGVSTTGVIVFPLSPTALLAMFSPDLRVSGYADEPHLTAHEAGLINQWVAANAYRWVFSRGDSTPGAVPLVPPPVPSFAVERDDSGDGELLRVFQPSRWMYCPTPERPSRWWP